MNKNTISLVDLLLQLEKENKVTFSYADEDVVDQEIALTGEKLRFRESLNLITSQLPLSITFIDEFTIALSRNTQIAKLCGIVTDHDNNALIGVMVKTPNTQTVTDNSGRFELSTEMASKVVTISYMGYSTLEVAIATLIDKPCTNIVLSEETLTLDEVLISNYITSGITKRRDGSLEVKYKEFGILPGLIEADVLLTAQALPGIQSVNEKVSDLNIRGGTNDQNLLLWDGIKMYQSGHFFGLISAFNPETTKKAKIYTNGTPAAYTDGVSGTILMSTQNTITEELSGSLGVNLLNANAQVDVPINKNSSLQFATRRSINDIYETPTYKSYFDQAFRDTEVTSDIGNSISSDQTFTFYDASLRWIYKIADKTLVKINGILISNDLVFLENGNLDELLTTRRSGVNQRNLSGGIVLEHAWNDFWQSTIQAYGSDYNLESTNTDFITNQRLIQQNNVLESSLRLETEYSKNRNTQFKVGYQLTDLGITNTTDVTNPIFRSSIKEVILSNALYGQLTTRFANSQGTVILGLRANQYGKLKKLLVEPRIVANYKLAPGLSAEIKGELKSQVTSQVINFQNDFIAVENRRWVLSNGTDIPIIKNQQVSAGFNYSKNGLLVSAEGYWKNVSGITTNSQGFQDQLQFVDAVGSYSVTGVDILLSKKLQAFKTSLGYSYATNTYEWEQLPNNIPTDFPNRLDVTHTVSTQFSYTHKERLKIAAGINWHSGRPFTNYALEEPIIEGNLNFNAPNSSTINNYFRTDVSATYRFSLGSKINGVASASLWNITNTRNTLNRYSVLSNNNPLDISRVALGRTPNASLKLSF